MRGRLDREKLDQFLHALAGSADQPTRMYLTGGASAVLLGWRDSTIDIDVKLEPEGDAILRAISRLKEELHVNVELASPSDFIPEPPGWESRSKFIMQDHALSVYHYDFYAQALSKIERFHERDVHDVREMLHRHIIAADRLKELFGAIEPLLFRFPAVNKETFKKNLDSILTDISFD